MNCNLEMEDKNNPLCSKLLLVGVFHHCDRQETETVVYTSNSSVREVEEEDQVFRASLAHTVSLDQSRLHKSLL